MKHLKAFSLIAMLGASALALTGCSSGGDSAEASDSGRLRVVATTTQLTDFAAEIGGDDIELTGLLPVGGSAHHFDPTAADLVALAEADVLIINGAGLEEFIDSAVQASGFSGTMIDASTGVDIELATEITLEASGDDHDHDHADDEHADDDHADDEADHDHADEADHDHDHADESDESVDEAEHDHDHGDLNPHLWTSVRFAEGMASMIAGDLARIDPDHADGYTERADAYIAKLAALDDWAATQFAAVPASERLLVSGHDSLRYFLHDYDIEFVGSILQSFEDNAEPSAAEIEELVSEIQARGVKAIFVESSMSPALAQTIANEAGITVVDSESLFADSLGNAQSGANTYIDATVHNVTTIVEAWGYTVEPLPTELQ